MQTWSNLNMKVFVPGRLPLKISCEIFLNLSSFECMTQFYLTNQHVNWIHRNLKFICSPFEVWIKILKSSQAWTANWFKGNLHVFPTYKPKIMTTLNDFTICHKGTGRCCKKISLALSPVHISLRILFIWAVLNSNFSTKFSSLLNLLRSPSIS